MTCQGLLKVGQSREDKLRRVSLKVDDVVDITFALQVWIQYPRDYYFLTMFLSSIFLLKTILCCREFASLETFFNNKG